MARKLRVGVIGRTGKGNYGHGIDTVWKSIPETEVVAVADEDPAGLAKAKEITGATTAYSSYRDMLAKEKLDLVGVGPRWLDQHRDMMVAAAEAGCHMYVEKPLCRTPAEADEIVQACEMRHVKLAIAHQSRYSPSVTVLLDLIKSGEIGDVLEVRGRGKEDRRGGGEDLWVLGSHVMDLMRLIAGDPIDCFGAVYSNGKRVMKGDVIQGAEGIGPLAGDHIQATFTFPNGVTGFFGSRRGMGGDPQRFGVQIFGSKGVAEVTFGFPAMCYILRGRSWNPARDKANWLPVTSNGIDKPETFESKGIETGNMIAVRDLLRAINEQRQPYCGVYDARWTIEMISAVFESHRLNWPVSFPLGQRENALSLLTD